MRLVTYLRASANSTSDSSDDIDNGAVCHVICPLLLGFFGLIVVIYITFCSEELFKFRCRCSSRWGRMLQRWLLPRLPFCHFPFLGLIYLKYWLVLYMYFCLVKFMSTLIFYRYVIQSHQISYGTPKSHYIRFEITPEMSGKKKKWVWKHNTPIYEASNHKTTIKNGEISLPWTAKYVPTFYYFLGVWCSLPNM